MRAARVLCIGVVFAATTLAMRPALAADAYCPDPAHATPAEVPADLADAVSKALEVPAADLHGAAYVRCVGPVLMGCYVGANLVCDKADTSRSLPGATAWCHDNPGSKFIPMAATGHATIYNWSCRGHRAVPGKAVVTVDPQGYIADNWKKIP